MSRDVVVPLDVSDSIFSGVDGVLYRLSKDILTIEDSSPTVLDIAWLPFALFDPDGRRLAVAECNKRLLGIAPLDSTCVPKVAAAALLDLPDLISEICSVTVDAAEDSLVRTTDGAATTIASPLQYAGADELAWVIVISMSGLIHI